MLNPDRVTAGAYKQRGAARGTLRLRLAAFAVNLSLAATSVACNFAEVEAEGEFGRPIALGSGDASPLPRLAFLPEPCPGTPGGCSEVCLGPPAQCDPGACMPILIDSATAITMLADDTDVAYPERTCFELRSAAQILDPQAEATVLGDALSRFRFNNTPVVRLPRDPAALAQPFGWRTGTAGAPAYVGGVLGGNVLRELAIHFAHRQGEDGSQFDVTFYREFPGSEAVLADQGRAAIPLQFPGLLLGKDITDVCQAGGENCDYLTTFDRERVASALRPSRMVLDACVAAPPATVEWVADRNRCRLAAGPASPAGSYHSATGVSGTIAEEDRGCVVVPAPLDTTDLDRGREASLVVATGVAGLILFEDSARRLLNELKLPLCDGSGGLGSTELTAPACIDGYIGTLEFPGWPPAGSAEKPLLQVRVRSVGLVPGLASSTGPSACERLELRHKALKAQCDSAAAGKSPRLRSDNSCADAARETAAVLGEAFVLDNTSGRPGPNPSRWITTVIVPDAHPMVTAMRRDTNPEALQPDGLIGTALFSNSEVVLDYTDGTPGVRISCSEPGGGTCVALPQCSASESSAPITTAACCFGLPENLLISLITDNGEYACCAALAPATRAELNLQAVGEGREPPCSEG